MHLVSVLERYHVHNFNDQHELDLNPAFIMLLCVCEKHYTRMSLPLHGSCISY